MEKFKFSKKFFALILSLLMVISSVPITTVYAATLKTVECPECKGNGVINCQDCDGGYTDDACYTCQGVGTIKIACTDCEDGTDGEENVCSTCGGEKEISVACSTCDGTGKEKCLTCNATEKVLCINCAGAGRVALEYEECPDCNGTGKCLTCDGTGIIDEICPDCYGEGTVEIDCDTCLASGEITEICSSCNGDKLLNCNDCSGTGKVDCITCSGNGNLADETECSDCAGIGKVDCSICAGNGKIECSACEGNGTIETNCADCSGTGKVVSDCTTCEGNKTVLKECVTCSGNKKCTRCSGTGEVQTRSDSSFKFDNENPSKIKVGDKFVNPAKSNNNTTGVITYSVDKEEIASVDENTGELTALKTGTVKVTAKIETDYVFSSKEISYEINIEAATPIIEFNKASDITYGQSLSDSIITAVAKVGDKVISGTFAWADDEKDKIPTVVNDSDTTFYKYIFTPDDRKNYTIAEGESTVTVKKADITGVEVKNLNPVYNGKPQDVISVLGILDGDKVYYSFDIESGYTEGLPKFTNVSENKEVSIKIERNGNYNEKIISSPATIQPSTIDGVKFEPYSGIYDGQSHSVITKISGDGYRDGDTVTYIYNGVESNELSFTNAGEYNFTVKISRNDDNYKSTPYPEETEITYVAVIAAKDVTVKADDVTKTYNDEEFFGDGATPTGLVEGHELSYVDIAGSATEVGSYILTPIKESAKVVDANNEDVTRNYNIICDAGSLTIIPKDVVITPKNVNVIYNAKSYLPNGYTIEGLVSGHKENVVLEGSATTVGEHKDAISVSGCTIFKDDRDVTSNYNVITNNAEIIISYLDLTEEDLLKAYTYSDYDGENEWYQSVVKITSENEYKICYTNDDADEFSGSLDYSVEGVTIPKISFMNKDGYITDLIEIAEIKIDTENPIVFEFEYSTALAYKLLEGITFGFYQAPATVTLRALDSNSDIASITYTVGDENSVVVPVSDLKQDNDGSYYITFEISKEFKGQVSCVAKDNSGRTISKSDNKGIIVDQTEPGISSIEYTNLKNSVDNKYYYSDNATTIFTIDEDYFYEKYDLTSDDAENNKNLINALNNNVNLKIEKKLHKSGSEYETYYEGSALPDAATDLFNAEFDEISNSISVTIPKIIGDEKNDGDYVITLSYTDLADNSFEISTDIIVIDTTNPTINVEYTPHINNNYIDGKAESSNYFDDEKRTATITVNEHNFDVTDAYFNVEITAEDADGNKVKDSNIEQIISDMHNIYYWDTDDNDCNIHTFTFDYNSDANYTFKISANDYSQNSNSPVMYKNSLGDDADAAEKFTVDISEPTDIKFGFEKTALSKILNVLTFGVFFNGEAKLRVEANDITAGLWKADISIKDLDGNNVSVFDENVKYFENNGSEGYVEFTITKDKLDIIKEFKGTIYIKVYDKSGNIYENGGEIKNGVITLIKGVQSINDKSLSFIDNYLVFESESSHIKHSSISITSKQNAISVESKQTDVDLTNYINDEYLEDASMAYKRKAPLYSGNVDFTVDFVDDYSGIAKAQIIVYNNNSGKEYINSIYDLISISAETSKGKVTWTNVNSNSNKKIVESSKAKFTISQNANDIVIAAIITDNAGNISYDYYNFGIDTTNPKIDYGFNTNGKKTSSGTYYSDETTFTLNVSERNFPLNSERVGTLTYKVNGVSKSKTLKASDFTRANNEVPYSDNQKYTYTLKSLKDEGQYENFEFETFDRADNSNTVSPKMTFYYDFSAPVVKIVSDKYSTVANDYFYQDRRVITVSVTDRYFNEKLFTYNNKSGNYNFVSDSEASEKYHTDKRTFVYIFTYETNTSIDCALTNLAAVDMSGNKAINVPTVANSTNFVIDGKTPQNFSAVITTPKNKSGISVSSNDYKVFVEDDITLTITSSDENLTHANLSNVTLVCRSLTSDGKTKPVEFKLAKVSSSRDKITYSVSNLDQDGFYELSYTVTDDSGKTSTVQNVSFAICRNGAMFNKSALDKITNSEKMFNADNVNSISFDQYSASADTTSILEISSDSVQFPRRVLELGTDYIIEPNAVQDRETLVYKSVYKLLRHAFELDNGVVLDGIYTIKITPVTTDANNNSSDNAPSQSFTVTLDATDPNLSARLDYTTSYNKVYENITVDPNDEFKLFAKNATLKFNLSDSYSGIDENTVEVKWNGKPLEYEIDKEGNYIVNLSSNNESNGNEIIIGALDNANNQVNMSFKVKLNSNFWLYVALGAFGLIAILAIIIILIIRRKNSNRAVE